MMTLISVDKARELSGIRRNAIEEAVNQLIANVVNESIETEAGDGNDHASIIVSPEIPESVVMALDDRLSDAGYEVETVTSEHKFAKEAAEQSGHEVGYLMIVSWG